MNGDLRDTHNEENPSEGLSSPKIQGPSVQGLRSMYGKFLVMNGMDPEGDK